jgi:membrane protein required for colicin V production
MGMNWVDLVVLAVVVVSALLGLMRGFVREALGVGAWVAAALAAVYGFHAVRPMVLGWVGDPNLADPLALGGVFLIVLIVLSVIAHAIAKVVRGSVLGSLDRTLGAVFGVARGAILIVAAYMVAGMVLPTDRWPPVVQQARFLPAVHDGAIWAAAQLPPGYRPQVAAPPGTQTPTSEQLMSPVPQHRTVGPPNDPK